MGSSTVLVLVICVIALQLAQLSNAQNTPDDFLRAHNSARAQVGVGPVSWDNTVASYARSYANQQQKDYCKPVHSSGPYGESISWAFGKAWTATDAVNSWVSEKQYYNYTTNTCAAGKVCRHYTQVVWEDSVRIGCARVVCNYGAIFITCNYDPPGNYVGQWPYSSPLLANI